MTSEERIAAALSIAGETKCFRMGQGVSVEAPAVFKEYFPGRKAALVADVHTWPVLGEKVYRLFQEAGIEVVSYIIDKECFHADWKYIEMVDCVIKGDLAAAKRIEEDDHHVESVAEESFCPASADYNILVSVGSGVINDLCKLSSHHHAQQYLTLPTAASVDGYSSFGASISYQNKKQTFNCPAPVAIVADIDVIAAAPAKMTAAGYGDLAAKIPAGAEWIVADFLGTEPINEPAWHVLHDYLGDMLSNPEGIAKGDPQAVADLFEGLTLSGFAMQIAQSSRPASCCDHLFSHIMDMTHYRYQGELQSHGDQVSIGTLTMCAVLDKFFEMDFSTLDVDACVAAWPTLEEEQQRALREFADFPAPELGYTELTKKYQDADVVRAQLTKLREQWPDLKARMQQVAYSFSKMHSLLQRAGAPCDPSHLGLTRQQLKDFFPKVQLMRYRLNVLDLCKRAGCYDQVVDAVFAPGAPLDLQQDPIS